MQLTITHNFPAVQAKLDGLRRNTADVVTARALNRTVDQARTQMSREIRAEFNLPAATVREKLHIKRASFKAGLLGLQAELYSRDPSGRRRSINVINFGARTTRQGVSVRIKRTGQRKTIRGAFIGNKGRTVFERIPGTKMNSRKGNTMHSQKIKPMQTIDVPQMFNVRRINAAVVAAINGRFPAIFERELAFAMRQFGQG